MAYVELTTKGTTDEFCSTDWNDMAGNMNLSVPLLFEAAGDLAVGTGSQAMTRLPVGDDLQFLQSSTDETYGLGWTSDFTGVSLTMSSVSVAAAGYTTVGFSAEDYDTDDFHETSPTSDNPYVSIPRDGLYLVSASAEFTDSTYGFREIWLRFTIDSTAMPVGNSWAAIDGDKTGFMFTFLQYMTKSDEVYMQLYSNTTAATAAADVNLTLRLLR